MTREAQFEGIQHGSVEFPFAWYHIRIPEYFLTYPVHWHDEIEIVYCIKGTFENTVGTKVITLNPGDFVIIPPQEIHSNRVIAGHEAEFITILFDLRFIKAHARADSIYNTYIEPFRLLTREFSPYIKKDCPLWHQIMPFYKLIKEVHKDINGAGRLAILGSLENIMYFLYQSSQKIDSKRKARDLPMYRIRSAIYKVQNEYFEDLTIKSVSSLCGYSESQFMKVFKETTGQSFNEYLISYRLNKARQMLISSDDKLIDIANSCGFNNQSYFTRASVKRYQTTPLEYRLQRQGN